MPSAFVGIRHDDEPLCPSDVEDAAVTLVNRLHIIEAGRDSDFDPRRAGLNLRQGFAPLAGLVHRDARVGRHLFGSVEEPEFQLELFDRGDLESRRRDERERHEEATQHAAS